ncbi:MAG TPA: DHA2 family efflux MFS transporter permease subunit [Miltoncostaeaceae bacterium]|nr:DHA2 family efflux MFS transporter permease subunit [Miltoncostaeaceae bacterium]
MEALIGFRVVQGLGGGMLMPLGMTIITKVAGPARMGRLMAILGVPILLGPVLGPIIGGWLIDAASWHWIFLINLPLGAAAIAYSAWVLEPDNPEPSETFDLIGMLLMSPGLALFLYGASSVPSAGTVMATTVLLPGIVGLALLGAFAVWAFRPRHPLLDLRLFHDRNMTVATIVIFLFAAAFFGALLLVPTYFQQVRGESVMMAGLLVAPQGLGAMLTMPLAGALSDRFPIGRIVPFGMLGIVIGIGGLALDSGVDTPYWRLITYLFITGLGMGATMMPVFTAALRTLRSEQAARGSTLINVVQQVASSIGVALMSVVLTNQQNASEPLGAFRAIGEATAAGVQPPEWATAIAGRFGDALQGMALSDLAGAFETAYWVATVALILTFIPVAFLPRKHPVSAPVEDGTEPKREPIIPH